MPDLYLWIAVRMLTILGCCPSYAFRIAAFIVVSGAILYFAVLTEPIYPTHNLATATHAEK